jgi:chromosome segregation ATPase
MNKKKILSLVLSILVVLPATAYAKGNNSSKEMSGKGQQVVQSSKENKQSDNENKDQEKDNDNENDNKDAVKAQEHKQEAAQNQADKKQQIQQFKTAMRAKHDQMADLRTQTKAVRSQVEQKREKLQAIIKDIEEGNKTLSPDMLKSLLDAAQNIKLDTKQVKAAAEISNEVADTQSKVNSKDFNNALASMDKVIARLQQRLAALKQLNSDLDAALAIANQAVVPAPASSTDSTSTAPATATTTGSNTTAPTTSTTTTNSNTTAPTTTTTTSN